MEFGLLVAVTLLAALATWHIYTVLEHNARVGQQSPMIMEHIRDVEHLLAQVREDARQNQALRNRRIREAREHVRMAADLVDDDPGIEHQLRDIDQLLNESLHRSLRDDEPSPRCNLNPIGDDDAAGS